jgi:hypothetical protein
MPSGCAQPAKRRTQRSLCRSKCFGRHERHLAEESVGTPSGLYWQTYLLGRFLNLGALARLQFGKVGALPAGFAVSAVRARAVLHYTVQRS